MACCETKCWDAETFNLKSWHSKATFSCLSYKAMANPGQAEWAREETRHK